MVEKRRWVRIAGLVALVALVVGAFSAFPVLAEDDEDPEDDVISYFCTVLEDEDIQHPVGGALAKMYDVDYEMVMGWFCDDGLGFGEIMLGLSTAELAGGDPQTYFDQLDDEWGWGEIWKDLDLIGRDVAKPTRGPAWGQDDDFTPPGQDEGFVPPGQMGRPEKEVPPEHAGPPDEVDPPMRIGPPEEVDPPVRIGPPEHANNDKDRGNNGNGH